MSKSKKATPAETEKTKSQPQPKPDFFSELYAPTGVRHPIGSGIPKNHPLANKGCN
jgi:hypothetical protein